MSRSFCRLWMILAKSLLCCISLPSCRKKRFASWRFNLSKQLIIGLTEVWLVSQLSSRIYGPTEGRVDGARYRFVALTPERPLLHRPSINYGTTQANSHPKPVSRARSSPVPGVVAYGEWPITARTAPHVTKHQGECRMQVSRRSRSSRLRSRKEE